MANKITKKMRIASKMISDKYEKRTHTQGYKDYVAKREAFVKRLPGFVDEQKARHFAQKHR